MEKPTVKILERIYETTSEHNDDVYTRLYHYLLGIQSMKIIKYVKY